MTEAEKAAAAKAAAAKKAEEDAKKKTEGEGAGGEADEEPEDEEPEDDSAKPITRAEFESFKKKSNKENEKHRLAAKTKAEELDAFKAQLFASLGVKPAGEEEKNTAKLEIEKVTKANEARLRKSLVRGEFMARAAKAGAADAADLYSLAKDTLAEVDVDLEEETVDADAIDDVIAGLKKKKKYLFTGAKKKAEEPAEGEEEAEGGEEDDTDSPTKKKPAKMPDGNRKPVKGGSAYSEWQTLVKSGRKNDANAYYAKNKPAIMSSWPK